MPSQLVYKQRKMGMRNILFELGTTSYILNDPVKSQPTKQNNLTYGSNKKEKVLNQKAKEV